MKESESSIELTDSSKTRANEFTKITNKSRCDVQSILQILILISSLVAAGYSLFQTIKLNKDVSDLQDQLERNTKRSDELVSQMQNNKVTSDTQIANIQTNVDTISQTSTLIKEMAVSLNETMKSSISQISFINMTSIQSKELFDKSNVSLTQMTVVTNNLNKVLIELQSNMTGYSNSINTLVNNNKDILKFVRNGITSDYAVQFVGRKEDGNYLSSTTILGTNTRNIMINAVPPTRCWREFQTTSALIQQYSQVGTGGTGWSPSILMTCEGDLIAFDRCTGNDPISRTEFYECSQSYETISYNKCLRSSILLKVKMNIIVMSSMAGCY